MNPLVHILSHSENSSFLIKKVQGPWFETDWHCHKEFVLILFTEGSGRVYTEIDIQNFESGDTCFIGSNVSHKFQQTGDQFIHATVVQFSDNCLGIQFMSLPGLMAAVKSYNNPSLLYAGRDQNKINAIDRTFLYTHNHFQDPITLRKAAAVACMSVPSFCFYFKHCTHKTYNDYLNEVRVTYACRQLQETNKPVADIGYESGYNTITHFHRQFLKQIKKTPLQYRKTLLSSQHSITLKISAQAI
jgi:AraC-like DNA-binding protein